MAKRLLVLLAATLAFHPVVPGRADSDNAAQAMGFVCRVLSDQNVAVVTPLSGMFPPDVRIRFLDDQGNVCATGTVRSSYPDLSYIALDNGSVDSLKNGFVAYSENLEAQARILCGYSMNLPLVTGKDRRAGHVLPPNAIVINYAENVMKPVVFRHYVHDFGCRTCHHAKLDTPCRQCHPANEDPQGIGSRAVGFDDCVRDKCVGCHKGHEGESSNCVWCHK